MTALIEAYRTTTYRVRLPNGQNIDARVGHPSPKLDDALRSAGAGCWGFVTACNPAPRMLSPLLNARRMLALRRAVRRTGRAPWFALGIGHSDWPSEQGVALLDTSHGELLTLARTFGQLAVVYGERGSPPCLIVDHHHPLLSMSALLTKRLEALRDAQDVRSLRQFAASAARSVLHRAPEPAARLVDAAEKSAQGEPVDLEGLRREFVGTAAAASLIGLRVEARNAPAFLAAFYACAPDAFDAAAGATRMVLLLAEMSGPEASQTERDLFHHLPSDS